MAPVPSMAPVAQPRVKAEPRSRVRRVVRWAAPRRAAGVSAQGLVRSPPQLPTAARPPAPTWRLRSAAACAALARTTPRRPRQRPRRARGSGRADACAAGCETPGLPRWRRREIASPGRSAATAPDLGLPAGLTRRIEPVRITRDAASYLPAALAIHHVDHGAFVPAATSPNIGE